ncbi:DUF5694 domain-containing protein [Aestuariibacter halophilus]|uniref:DUF5694 domain-containing protein n=1 Tax=Fluctibacter halophilus TaxID=226011 RepID=A0ABS8G6Y8_9ALTE|nr:DUF5694 domain-containing protein [Aestuariibacter halophilus]MCC2616249.1 DUF5694 domain-containing protein [Aestuariibacter halophilus]
MNARFCFVFFCAMSWLSGVAQTSASTEQLDTLEAQLKSYDQLADTSVMVVGTLHFSASVLTKDNQDALQALVTRLADYKPTKVVLEWEPRQQAMVDEQYAAYLNGAFSISQRHNEVYQLGFRLAKHVGLKRLHLFDDQTPFDGTLNGFTFDVLSDYAKAHDKGFYDRHEAQLIETFEHNEALLTGLNLYQQIALRNSSRAQHINAQRIHLYENRIGIQDSWLGPDWLGRWYRRNVRMSSNVLALAEPGDRILIIVGDNHKWTLDYLFEQIPEFTVDSSWQWLKE